MAFIEDTEIAMHEVYELLSGKDADDAEEIASISSKALSNRNAKKKAGMQRIFNKVGLMRQNTFGLRKSKNKFPVGSAS